MRALRCCCGRCAGSVIFTSISEYLAHHQLEPGEYVLDSEVEFVDVNHPSNPGWRPRSRLSLVEPS